MSDDTPITAIEARFLFAGFAAAPAVILAVSGGPDSTALLWLAARWRKARRKGPKLIAVTVDHGLRRESAAEARAVKRLAVSLGVPHVTRSWRGDKPATGVPAAARAARYRLLEEAAKAAKASHILTAHTRDDQAETVLMRLAKGSGLTGLAAMAHTRPLAGVDLARPFLDVSKSRLVATLTKAKVGFVDDPTNCDPAYLRPRLRGLMPDLAADGLDSRGLLRFARRMARAEAALERMADGAERYLAKIQGTAPGFDAAAFAALPEEIRVRLLQRAIGRAGHEGPAELGKVETLVQALTEAEQGGRPIKRTLGGALITLAGGRLGVVAAPRRRPLIL
jgi:tRNA(Ile)-lysidine synthase